MAIRRSSGVVKDEKVLYCFASLSYHATSVQHLLLFLVIIILFTCSCTFETIQSMMDRRSVAIDSFMAKV